MKKLKEMNVQLLIVVNVTQGRNFQTRQSHSLLIEAKFDGEVMSTDPVPHTTDPDFSTELAWEVDKRSLHLHRLQRTPIKLHCFAINNNTQVKEPVGYVVLDIRPAQENKADFKWHTLLNSKHARHKPELLLCVYLERETPNKLNKETEDQLPDSMIPSNDENVATHMTPLKNKKEKFPLMILQSNQLKPLLNSDEGFYQIGPIEKCQESFIFSVTVAFAANLSQIKPTSKKVLPAFQQYHFYYSLLGNDVRTESFTNLDNPEFPAERASVRIRSNFETLSEFFKIHPPLKLFLCCGDVLAGSAEVNLQQLLEGTGSDLTKSPATLGGTFLVKPSSISVSDMNNDEAKPVVGVSVTLKKDDLETNPQTINEQSLDKKSSRSQDETLQSHISNKDILATDQYQNKQSEETIKRTSGTVKNKNISPSRSKGSYQKLEFSISPSQKLEKQEKNFPSKAQEHNCKETETDTNDHKGEKNLDSIVPVFASSMSEYRQPDTTTIHTVTTTTAATVVNSGDEVYSTPGPEKQQTSTPDSFNPRHFCFTLDLRSLQIMQNIPKLYCFLRYSYPFFGSSAPILTHPCVTVNPGSIVTLPHGYCAFNFATSIHQLHNTFTSIPLLVEVVQKDQMESKNDQSVGTARISLRAVLDSSASTFISEKEIVGVRRISTCKVSVNSSDGNKMGELHAVMSLDDFGPANLPNLCAGNTYCTIQETSENQNKTTFKVKKTTEDVGTGEPLNMQWRENITSKTQQPKLNEQKLIQAALELEMWKEQQELLFKKHLKEKEAIHLQTLTSEWKRRDTEREVIVQKRVQECKELENKLKKALADIEIRERQLVAKENELVYKKSSWQRWREQIEQETKEAIRRTKVECDHLANLEKKKVQDLLQQRKKLEQQVKDLENKVKEKDETIENLQQEQSSRPEIQLQSEINILNMEKVELQRKLDVAVTAKKRFKQQWGQALRQISLLQNRLYNLDQMYSSKQDSEAIIQKTSTTNQQKEAILQQAEEPSHSDEAMKRKDNAEMSLEHSSPSPIPLEYPSAVSVSTISQGIHPLSSGSKADTMSHHLQRLIEERNILLGTGVYTEKDKIIMELNKHIELAITRVQR
ncbi:centrosomal protein of 120 kDa-like isoform X2 [Limulus polyphemus]|uniref:Centrosomal protein of 120 kDa-like isoform X2 n=1 Tax=Limulus polyphemus TaxID=6850 RepID=A0ABM1SNI2_LIMPO|nr:centrosomal protein of 120 kDa-like isoform X2 [Limulus polyphemus]